MKNGKYGKIISSVTAVALACSFGMGAIACGEDEKGWTPPANTYEYDIPQDYCRTYYEVFVRSFADSNGDGIGDLRGLADNLDYLNDGDDSTVTDLGINGIWMMPINKSPSYHKYDVIDYYSIDSEYGTLEDFDYLVSECNKRGIWLQMDLVLNHTSTEHEWFKAAQQAARDGKSPFTDPDMLKYEFKRSTTNPSGDGKGTWYKVSGTSDYWYLGNFSSAMPDVRLTNSAVRAEIQKIVDFWLERGIRSFRLDAVPWACAYDTEYNEANGEFWTWFNDYCDQKGAEVYGAENDGINAYCYNVGEVWAGSETVNDFFGTGMSNFNYSMGADPAVGFCGVVNDRLRASTAVENLARFQASALELDGDALLSNFLSNHDNDRSAGYFQRDPKKIKMAAGLYLLAPGNPYIYYGEEIGALGSGVDENKRLAFNWGDKRKVKDPGGANYEGKQALGTVKSQTGKADSILTYYRNAVSMRNRFPEIGRGIIEPYALNASGALQTSASIRDGMEDKTLSLTSVNALNRTLAAYTLTWKGRKILIVQNVGAEEININLGDYSSYGVAGTLYAAGGEIVKTEGSLKLPSGSVALLKAE